MLSNELGFVLASTIIAVFVTIVFVGQINLLGDDSAEQQVIRRQAVLARNLLDELLETFEFGGRDTRLRPDEKLAAVAKSDEAQQRPLQIFERVMQQSGLQSRVVALNGDVVADTVHKDAGRAVARPLASLADSRDVTAIVAAGAVARDGSFIVSQDARKTFVVQLVSYPSFVVVMTASES
jgi:hypothetical protein